MKWSLYALMIAGLSMVCGCLSPRTSGMAIEKGRIIVDDASFALNLEMVEDVCERTPEGFLHAQVVLRNSNATDYAFQYQFVWKDGNGLVMKHAKSLWTPIVLHGHQETVLDTISTVPNVADFRLYLRRAAD